MRDYTIPSGDYPELVEDLNDRIRSAQCRAGLAVNSEVLLLYWSIGRDLLLRQKRPGWGESGLDCLADDLRREFPDRGLFSPGDLEDMRAFAEAWPDERLVRELAARLPWSHNLCLLQQVKDASEREWYARATIENGWSWHTLTQRIGDGLYQRRGEGLTDHQHVVLDPRSELAEERSDNHTNFAFLNLVHRVDRRQLQQDRIPPVRDIILGLGGDLAVMRSPVLLEKEGEDLWLDLLFCRVHGRGFVAVDLRNGDFEPEYADRMNLYLAAVDDQLRHPGDPSSVGITLCDSGHGAVVVYARRDARSPLGIETFLSGEPLPDGLMGSLPPMDELRRELDDGPFWYDIA